MTSLKALLIGHPSVCSYCSICGSSSLIQINLSTQGGGWWWVMHSAVLSLKVMRSCILCALPLSRQNKNKFSCARASQTVAAAGIRSGQSQESVAGLQQISEFSLCSPSFLPPHYVSVSPSWPQLATETKLGRPPTDHLREKCLWILIPMPCAMWGSSRQVILTDGFLELEKCSGEQGWWDNFITFTVDWRTVILYPVTVM